MRIENRMKHTEKHGEIREDRTSGDWVIFSPARGDRPEDYNINSDKQKPISRYDPDCPFCPGNEAHLEKILHEATCSKNPGWFTRTVPNRYPVLRPNGDTNRRRQGIYLAMPGAGRHEVIIETPRHNGHPARASIEEVEAVIETYHQRHHDILKKQELDMIIIFKNHGKMAGTSLMHPHSQVVAANMVPQTIRRLEEEAERYNDRWGCCVYCDILKYEKEEGVRLVLENDSFVVFVPFAAKAPFEIWIVPKRHKADFGSVTDIEKRDFAEALRSTLGRLDERLGDPDYNYVINTATRHKFDVPYLHWHLRIRPRLTTIAGFEIGSGMNVNPSMPEDDARFLR